MMNRSYFLQSDKKRRYPKLKTKEAVDFLVIGAGISGVSIAYELCINYPDKSVMLVDQNQFGHGTSTSTTAKLTILQGDVYHKIKDVEKRKALLDFNILGQKRILDIIEKENIECDLQFENAYTYAASDYGAKGVFSEYEALRELKVDASLNIENEYVKEAKVLVEVKNQASFNPYKYLNSMIKILEKRGVLLYESTRVIKIENQIGFTLNNEEISFSKVFYCTNYPSLKKLDTFFLKMEPVYSYVISTKYGKPFSGVYISTDEHVRSLRKINDTLIIAGESTKNQKDPRASYTKLMLFGHDNFGLSSYDNKWMGMDYETFDLLPYIGEINDNEYLLTGYGKWGFLKAVAGAKLIVDGLVEESENNVLKYFSPKRVLVNFKQVKYLLKTGKHYITTAFHKKRCTHLNCGLIYNKEEKTYDCPCHGSRFFLSGKVFLGPAKKDLEKKKNYKTSL